MYSKRPCVAEPQDIAAGRTGLDERRPLVTFYLVTYNHERFVRQAVESALAQTYRPIQFIFSDDCSTDRSFEIMREMAEPYVGKEDILLNRNERNLGTVDHLNRIFFELARGKYFVPLAGDDVTSPDRTEKVVTLFESTGASAVSVNPVMIDENGQPTGSRFHNQFPHGVLHFREFIGSGSRFFGGGGYAGELFEIYGPMKNNVRNEDRILPLRASVMGGIAYLENPVYFYREHGNNMSFRVKSKLDPVNKAVYAAAANRNERQNIENFRQEIQAVYQGPDRERILAIIEAMLEFHRTRTNG